MALTDGVIKFNLQWDQGPAPAGLEELHFWRDKLYALHLVGAYPDGVGFGNLSIRSKPGFIITGSATGAWKRLDPEHYTRVMSYNFRENSVHCQGPIRASSESLTHAALYEACPDIQAVIHVHSRQLWQALIYKVPTTENDIPYGTPEMAFSIQRIVQARKSESTGLIVMAGHEEGLVAYGPDLQSAGDCLLRAFAHNSP